MSKLKIFAILVFIFSISLSIFLQSCKDDDDIDDPQYLEVTVPRHELRHDLYYRLEHDERSIELDFNLPIDITSLVGNIILSDKSGSLEAMYDMELFGRQVLIIFNPDFELKDGWKYELLISKELKSTNNESVKKDLILEFRTTAKTILEIPTKNSGIPPADTVERSFIACISDIHMGQARAEDDNYCWFGENADALSSFLDYVVNGGHIKQLVILGDLFDEWLVPYTFNPFDPQTGINNSKEYFESIANSATNKPIIDKFKAIVNNNDIELVYVPGNHDMLLTNEILQVIIPGITWQGGASGLGKYSPFDEMVMEHGHRYDFFNCPQPLVNPDHILPPGYFISRLYAEGMMESSQPSLKATNNASGSFEFNAAWDVAYVYTVTHFNMTMPVSDSANIPMGGINGYSDNFSFDGAQEMYAANIEDNWAATQAANNVQVPTECCFHAIWNGHSDLFDAATTEYMESPAPKLYKVVSFGHTHQPEIKVYPPDSSYTSIYSNTGSWVNAKACDYDVRTYLLYQRQ